MSRLHLERTEVEGCYIIEAPVFEDHRGSFMETFNAQDFLDVGLPTIWPQDNIGVSKMNVVRGLHIQRANPQGKLIRCISGMIFDVCLDLRRNSPTFGKLATAELKAGNPGRSFYCPPGTAHGFLAQWPESVIHYKCTTLYDKASDGGIFPFDRPLRHIWPIDPARAIISEKDQRAPGLHRWLEEFAK